jgi:6-phosphogluconolactonase
MMDTPITTIVAKDANDATRKIATRILELAEAAAERPLTVALSGGSTPKLLYETLAGAPFGERIPWRQVELFFGDERSVPPEHADSNYGMVKRALLDRVPVRAHRMAADAGEADAYERLIRERVALDRGLPVFDVVLLGIGKDGHTASLFPGTKALEEKSRWVVMNDVPQMNTSRMTLTFPVINNARHVWVLATGADKREIVSACLGAAAKGRADPRWPVLRARPDPGELIWWLDEGSAGQS